MGKPLIVISSPYFLDNEIQALISLQEMGLSLFHLRKPLASFQEISDFLKRLPICCQNICVLHQFHEMANLFPVKGLHFNRHQSISPTTDYGNLLLSQAAHTWEEVLRMDNRISNILLSPLFPSISKPDTAIPLDPAILKHGFSKYTGTQKVIGLGGITPDTIQNALEIGFDGVAVLGYLWEEFRQSASIPALQQKYRCLEESLLAD